MTKSSKGKAPQIVSVDAGKLAKGLKATFEGVAMVFDALGADAGIDMSFRTEPEQAEKPEKPEKQKKPVKEEKSDNAAETMDDTGTVDDPADAAGDDVSADEQEPPVTEKADQADEEETADSSSDEQTDTPAEKPVAAVSLDDVTKIIVQKIKKDRSNNEKIGQILKTYGVVKVGELDSAKYEAFLTDVAAL